LSHAVLVSDFRKNSKSLFYSPYYLRNSTRKGKWETIGFNSTIPAKMVPGDTVLVYFYLPACDEELLIDDFCAGIVRKIK
jgi:hypothetical protein